MNTLQLSILKPFIDQSIIMLKEMAHFDAAAGDAFEDDPEKFRFKGYAIAAHTTGKINGTILMHHYVETTVAIGNRLLSESFGEKMNVEADDEDLADAIDEWANTAIGLAMEALRLEGLAIEFSPPYFINNTKNIDELMMNVKEILSVPISVGDVGRFYFNYLLEDATSDVKSEKNEPPG